MKRIATTEFRDCLCDRFINARASQNARLAPTHLLTHEMGVEGNLREELTPAEWSRVEFYLGSANVKSAELLFYEIDGLPLNALELHQGDNELAARSVNLFGRMGRVARARVRRT